MTEETTQVHPTSQEAEPTQQDVNDLPDQSTGEPGEQPEAENPGEQEGGKDPNEWAIKRIGALTAKSHEAERKAEAKTREAEHYRLLVEQMQRGETPAEQVTKPGEQPNIDELVQKRATELEQQRAITERGQSVSKVGGEAYPDFMTAVSTLDALGISGEQVQSLLGMDDAHKVIYSLGKNPEEAARILALPPLQQGRELERLASKPTPVAPVKAVSKAPAPVKTIDSTVAADADPESMSMEAWAKWRQKNAKTRI